MALTGKAKKDYQRKYMKEYMRNKRAGLTVKTQPKQGVMLRPEQPVVIPHRLGDLSNYPPTLGLGVGSNGNQVPPIPEHRQFTGELTKTRQVSDKGFNG